MMLSLLTKQIVHCQQQRMFQFHVIDSRHEVLGPSQHYGKGFLTDGRSHKTAPTLTRRTMDNYQQEAVLACRVMTSRCIATSCTRVLTTSLLLACTARCARSGRWPSSRRDGLHRCSGASMRCRHSERLDGIHTQSSRLRRSTTPFTAMICAKRPNAG